MKQSEILKRKLTKAIFCELLEEKANTYEGATITIQRTHDDGAKMNTGYCITINKTSITTEDTKFVEKLLALLDK